MKRILALVIVCGFVLGLVGCAGRLGNEPPEIKLAIGMGGNQHPVHRIVQYGFHMAIEERGLTKIDATLNKASSQELMVRYEKAVVEEGAQGMMLWTGDDVFYQFMRDMKKEHGTVFVVPHFTHEYVDTKNFIDANLHYDERMMGEMAADMMVEALYAKGITSGSIGNTQAGAGVSENASSDAFRARLREIAPQFRVCDVVFAGLDISAATKNVGIIQSNSDLVGAFGTTATCAQAWTEAMGHTGRSDLVVIAVSASEDNLKVVENGPIHALVTAPLYEEGYDSAGVLHDVITGKSYNQTKEDWDIVYDVIGLTKDSDLTAYHDLFANMKEGIS